MKFIAKLSIVLLVGGALLGCTANSYRQDADQETYEAIADKTNLVPGMTERIGIDEENNVDLSGFPTNEQSYDFLDNEADSEIGAHILSLNAALDLAFQHSQVYQTQKESLYLEALALTFDRYRYTPVFSAGGGADYQWDAEDQFVTDMQALTGMSALSTSERVDASTSLGARYFLKSGGAIALNLTNNFTRFLTGDVSELNTGALIGSFTQPLLRDFGTAIETENLM